MDYSVSRQFHDTYKNLYEHIAVVTLKDGTTVKGGRYNEFFASIEATAPVID